MRYWHRGSRTPAVSAARLRGRRNLLKSLQVR
jgi:hypothetical protein